MQKLQKQLRDSFQDDIGEMSKPLQDLLKNGLDTGVISEEDVISDVDDMDLSIKMIEKFYELADKLSIKIITIEEALEKEAKEANKESKLGKLELYDTKKNTSEAQHKDFIKLYFNEISKIPLLNSEEERDISRRVKKGDDEAKKRLIESNLRLVISIAKRFF